MYIGQFGGHFNSVESIPFRSKKALFDYDALVVDLNSIAVAYTNANYYKTQAVPTDRYSDEFIEQRITQIKNHYQAAKPLIFLTPVPQNLIFRDQSLDISSFCPIEFETNHAEGKKIDFLPKTKFSEFLNKYKDKFNYDSFFESFNGLPLAKIKDTKNVISFYKDKVCFIPRTQNLSKEEEKTFLSELIAAIIRKDSANFEFPNWAKNYYLPNEENLSVEIKKLISEKQKIEDSIKVLKEKVHSIAESKSLFFSNGDLLENQIKKLFFELGFELLPALPNRDDIIMKYGETIIVCEVKGVSGTAAEKQAAQLEKWVSEYHIENGILPKGILIENTFKDIEVKERIENSWPHQMLDYSKKRGHCLITSLQLLCLYLDILQTPEKKDSLIDDMLKTEGVYSSYSNWQDFIQYNNPSMQ